MTQRRLYSHPLSGNAHKVRLMLNELSLPYELIDLDLLKGEQRGDAFLKVNPLGQVPVLSDGDVTLRDSHAILVYLARKYNGHAWFPDDAESMGRIMQWISFSANEIFHGPFAARIYYQFGIKLDIGLAHERSLQVLKILDQHLSTQSWLELDRPTIADIACFPYVALSREGKIQLDDFTQVLAWIERIKALPCYLPMPGL